MQFLPFTTESPVSSHHYRITSFFPSLQDHQFLPITTGSPVSSHHYRITSFFPSLQDHQFLPFTTGTKEQFFIRGVYPLCAMMSHFCCNNTHHTLLDDMTMVVIASTPIKKGEQITGKGGRGGRGRGDGW